MPRMTEEQRKALLRQYAAGVPMRQIAEEFNVSVSYPSQLAARYNVRRRIPRAASDREAEVTLGDALAEDIAKPVGPTPMNVNTAAEIKRLAAKGTRRTQIAALLRCPYRVVDEALA